jgi:hypothetical protein
MSVARCAISTDKRLSGVCIRIAEVDDRNVVTNATSVVYTPAIARQVAHDILIEADKVDALGGPTPELTKLCIPSEQVQRNNS